MQQILNSRGCYSSLFHTVPTIRSCAMEIRRKGEESHQNELQHLAFAIKKCQEETGCQAYPNVSAITGRIRWGKRRAGNNLLIVEIVRLPSEKKKASENSDRQRCADS